ncbi:MAG: heavy metal-binding domain-containing protein [Pseudomonadota bacterium]
MIITTKPSINGRPITGHKGIAEGEAIMGPSVFRSVFAIEAQQLAPIAAEGDVG